MNDSDKEDPVAPDLTPDDEGSAQEDGIGEVVDSDKEEPVAPDLTPDDNGSELGDGMGEIVNEFLVESYEDLDQLDQDLIGLEQNPGDINILSSIFRTIHTIKGACGFIGFSKLESVAHIGGNLLGKLRDGELTLTTSRTSALLAMVDAIRQMLSCIENDQNEGTADYSDLVETLAQLQADYGKSNAPAEPIDVEAGKNESAPAFSGLKTESASETHQTEPVQPSAEIDEDMELIVNMFLVESYENLDRLDKDLVELEQDSGNTETLSRIFRTIHTIKGSCGFIGLHKLERVAHVGENLLGKLRDGELVLNPSRTNALLAMVDAIRQMLNCIESKRNEDGVDYSSLVNTLGKLLTDEGSAQVAASAPAPAEEKKAEKVFVPVEEKIDRRQANPVEEAGYVARHGDKRFDADRRKETREIVDSSIRVEVDILDRLMNLVDELVLARNQILQYATAQSDSTFTATSRHLNLVATELQEGIMKTRIQPIGNIWSKFPRVVRDLSMAVGKKIRLEMEGNDTELDKTLIEAIKDPLMHIIRNSCDHGIESPEKRAASGKDEVGVLLLRAFHEGGQVNIEIIDDGGGIDPEKIKNIALSKNVITQEQAERMGGRELVNLIFTPGFSTVEKVTNVSGRGVGMDVVRTSIEKIGGSVDIQSIPGKGTTLRVKIPLTLAIIPALIITTAGERYAIPQVNLLELVCLDGEQAKTSIKLVQGAPVYRLRGNLLPLVFLNDELQVAKEVESDAVNIVILHAGDCQFGLVVEGISDTEEILVKPLGKQLKGIPVFSGATIMGDGKLALILDVMGLAQKAQVIGGDRQALLIFALEQDDRMAIPLSEVARLEQFKRSDMERSGEQDVVRYRGGIMPLIYLRNVLNMGVAQEDSVKEVVQAVVFTKNDRSVGMIVERIIDIVEEVITVKCETNRPGVLGTIVVQDRVTDLLDVENVVRAADPSFLIDAKDVALVEEG
jgi:two-component system, chemotaxis family, sensor kinase CheA